MIFTATGKTAVYGVIGDPIAHSLSPIMQNAAFRFCRIDAVYVAFHVLPSDLPAAINGVRALGISGLNVTIPHKETIVPLLDRIDPAVEHIGAVNTVINRGGELTGYNTDVSGFVRSLREELDFIAYGKRVLVLGAGGASRAAVQALVAEGAYAVTVANRHVQRGHELISTVHPTGKHQILRAVDYGSDEYLQMLGEADLIVNTTSVGLHGEKLDFLPLENIKGSALIYDMLYSLTGTPLTKAARLRGLRCVDGLSMLAAQGEDAFRLWTGEGLPAGFMRRQLLEYQYQRK